MTRDERNGSLVLVLTTLLWAISFPLIGGIVDDDPNENEFVFLALRFTLATLAFAPIARTVVRQASGRGLVPWAHGAIVGTLLFLGYWTQTVGLKYTTPSRSAFVTMLSVPLVPLLAALVRGRRPSPAHLIGGVVAVAGVGIVLAPSGSVSPNVGDLWTLVCAVVFAVEILVMAHYARRNGAAVLVVATIGTVMLLSIGGWVLKGNLIPLVLPDYAGVVVPKFTAEFWIAVAVTGVVCTTLAIGGMTWAQGRISPEAAAMIFALEPVFAGVFEHLLFGKGMVPIQWAGGAVVVAAVAWTARVPVPGDEPTVP